jgi:hypothetical protein
MMRRPTTLAVLLVVGACGGVSTRKDTGRASAGSGGASAGAEGGSTDEGGACAEPASGIPDLGAFQPPPGPLVTYQVTLHNRCAQTVWPAWGTSGGLDNSVIDTQLWLPMSPASDRSVKVYGGVREIGFWGRTGCSFDGIGVGACATGDCGAFVCPIEINVFPLSATVFVLEEGFLEGYNLPLRVEGPTCGNHECVLDARTCSDASVVKDACGRTIACNDLCDTPPGHCCMRVGSGCTDGNPSDGGDLVVTFCP